MGRQRQHLTEATSFKIRTFHYEKLKRLAEKHGVSMGEIMRWTLDAVMPPPGRPTGDRGRNPIAASLRH